MRMCIVTKRSFYALALLLASGSESFAGNRAATIPIPNFQVVQSDLFRGGRPENAGLLYLKSIGVKTILNIENEMKVVAEEMREAEALGIREISIPFGYWKPKNAKVDAALDIINDRSLRPLYVHCRAGRDRTGVVMGISRVEHEGWSSRTAYAEMKKYGFHSAIFWMASYFKKRTGYYD